MSELKSWILIIIVAFALSFLIRAYVVQPYRVEMTSMLDTLYPDDLVIVDKISYRFRIPKRGEVVVFAPPDDITSKYIKRVIGLPGETISIRNGKVYINGGLLNEPYVNSPTFPDLSEVNVPEGCIFVMGDNRSVSYDSRRFGPIKVDSIVGRALFVYWPFTHLENLCAYSEESP